MVRHAAAVADGWRDGERVDVVRTTRDLTLRMLTDALFGTDLDPERRKAVWGAVEAFSDKIAAQSLAAFVPTWVPIRTNRRYRRGLGAFDAVVADLLAERRAADEPGEDLTDLLLTATDERGRPLGDEELRDQLVTFLFAGHETTAAALAFVWHALASHPDAAERVRAEVRAVCGDRDPTAADFPALAFTRAVVSETLRLYPPVFATFRQANAAVELGGYRIPRDAQLALPQLLVHRDPRWYDEPDAFRPERWLDDVDTDRPEHAYFPFGGGPRHCIGMRFGLLELVLVTAVVARRVAFEPVGLPDLGLAFGTTLQPKGGLTLAVRTAAPSAARVDSVAGGRPPSTPDR